MTQRLSTDAAGVAKCLGLQAEAKVAFEKIVSLLEAKLKDEFRLFID